MKLIEMFFRNLYRNQRRRHDNPSLMRIWFHDSRLIARRLKKRKERKLMPNEEFVEELRLISPTFRGKASIRGVKVNKFASHKMNTVILIKIM